MKKFHENIFFKNSPLHDGAIIIVNNKIKAARVALGGVAHKPWRATKAESALVGKNPKEETFRDAAEAELAAAKGYKHNSFKIELAKRAIARTCCKP